MNKYDIRKCTKEQTEEEIFNIKKISEVLNENHLIREMKSHVSRSEIMYK